MVLTSLVKQAIRYLLDLFGQKYSIHTRSKVITRYESSKKIGF